jgi:hypothetical protein
MSPVHFLGLYGKDNSSQILDLFKEFIKDFDLDQKDLGGNSGKMKTANYFQTNIIFSDKFKLSITTCLSKWKR